jgi:hypothetical protein
MVRLLACVGCRPAAVACPNDNYRKRTAEFVHGVSGRRRVGRLRNAATTDDSGISEATRHCPAFVTQTCTNLTMNLCTYPCPQV